MSPKERNPVSSAARERGPGGHHGLPTPYRRLPTAGANAAKAEFIPARAALTCRSTAAPAADPSSRASLSASNAPAVGPRASQASPSRSCRSSLETNPSAGTSSSRDSRMCSPSLLRPSDSAATRKCPASASLVFPDRAAAWAASRRRLPPRDLQIGLSEGTCEAGWESGAGR